jgi:hypothetical protein
MERFLIRTEDGPMAGEVRVANTEGDPVEWAWPLPDVLLYDETGRYLKVSESELPPQEEDSRTLRGASYEWQSTP